jgi:hypothetical protein
MIHDTCNVYQITWQSNNVVLNKIAKTEISNVCAINCCRQFCHHLSTICEHNIFRNKNPDSKLSIFRIYCFSFCVYNLKQTLCEAHTKLTQDFCTEHETMIELRNRNSLDQFQVIDSNKVLFSVYFQCNNTRLCQSIVTRDEIKPVQAIKILKVLKKVERVENFEKKFPNI